MIKCINGEPIQYGKLPERFQGGVERYIEHGIMPGDFLSAVICNDLREACGRADLESREQLFELVSWFYTYAPRSCWGSREDMVDWVEAHISRRAEEADEESPAFTG